MVFRVTPRHFADNAVRWSTLHNSKLQDFQTQISTGLKIQKPSDDPGSIGSLLANKASVARIDIDISNITTARSKLNQSVAQLISAKEALSSANSLAIEGIQSTEDERKTLADQVNSILDRMLQVANSTDGGKPLYAGTGKSITAFASHIDPKTGDIDAVQYQGSDDRSRIVIGVLSTVDALYAGSEVFLARGRGETIYTGKTGVAHGVGTDSATNTGVLQVRHTSTTISGSSGLASSSAAADDTLLGTHTLTVDGTAMTLQLDGGSRISFTSADTNIVVTSESGATVHLDASSFVPGFSGSITVSGDGTLSIDDGTTTVPVDFSANQALVDPTTGKVTYVDTTNIDQSGDAKIDYQDTTSVFDALIQLRDELYNRRDLTNTEWQAAMQRRLGDIQRVHNQILEVVSEQSVSLEALDGIEARAESYKLETQQAISDRESADISSAVVNLQSEQNLLQFTYAVSAQVMSISLLDYLN